MRSPCRCLALPSQTAYSNDTVRRHDGSVRSATRNTPLPSIRRKSVHAQRVTNETSGSTCFSIMMPKKCLTLLQIVSQQPTLVWKAVIPRASNKGTTLIKLPSLSPTLSLPPRPLLLTRLPPLSPRLQQSQLPLLLPAAHTIDLLSKGSESMSLCLSEQVNHRS